jgi:hypothetical protein
VKPGATAPQKKVQRACQGFINPRMHAVSVPPSRMSGFCQRHAYEPLNTLAALENVVLAFVPIDWMAVKQTTTISDSITAYSTAVGPSSAARNRQTLFANGFMAVSPRT